MPVTSDKPAPYASPSTIIELVQRHRTKGLPQLINSEVLARAGVSESLIPRTLQTLQSLDLIDDQGKITQVFEGIRLAPEAEYQKRMAEWLNAAYADVLQYIDPSIAAETEIRDAFRTYVPTGQQGRMVTLFIGLYAAAGVGTQKLTSKSPSTPRATSAPARRKTPIAKPETKKFDSYVPPISTGLPPALDGLLKSLPTNGQGWTKEQRDSFYTTFGAVLDFCIPIGVQNVPTTEDTVEEDEE